MQRVTPEKLEAEWQKTNGTVWPTEFLGRWFPDPGKVACMNYPLFHRINAVIPDEVWCAGRLQDPLIRARVWSIVCSE